MIRTSTMLLLAALPALALAAGPSSLSPIQPRVNGLLAADHTHASFNVGAQSAEGITLSWRVRADGSALGRELKVAAFVVDLVGAADGATPLTWSSGEMRSSESSLRLPRSLVQRFAPGASFSWKVRLRDALTGTYTAWSEETSFDTAPPASVWAGAAWIGGGSELRTDAKIPAGTIKSARAFTSGVGVMELHLNGAKVADHYCDPGEAVYDQKILFLSFNVTSLLKAGSSNALGARLGNSKWGYLDIYSNRTKHADQSGDSSRAFRMALVVTMTDGKTHTIKTTTAGWKYRHGPIVYDHLWHGEIYDARQSLEGWSSKPLSAFGAAAGWQPAKLMSGTKPLPGCAGGQCNNDWKGAMYPQQMQPIRRTLSYPAVKVSGPTYDAATTSAGVSSDTPPSLLNVCQARQWRHPLAVCAAATSQQACLAHPLKCAWTPPMTPKTWPSGYQNHSVLFDFGLNMAGMSSLTFDPSALRQAAAAAQLRTGSAVYVRMEHTEIVDEQQHAFNNYYPGMEFNHISATCSMSDWYKHGWYECANQTDGYIFELPSTDAQAAAAAAYTQSFTYHGFRFIQLSATVLSASGKEAPLPPALLSKWISTKGFGAQITAHRAHTDFPKLHKISLPQGTKEAKILGQLLNATLSSHVSNAFSIPTDCPQREKRGWMGDAGISSDSLNTFYDAYSFHANFLRLLGDNQVKSCTEQEDTPIYSRCTNKANKHATLASDIAWFNGSVPDVTPFPTGPYGGNPGTTDWQTAFPIIAHSLLKHYGAASHDLLTEVWPSLDLFMGYLDRLVQANPKSKTTGLLLDGARGDWVPPGGNGGSKSKPPTSNTPTSSISAFFHTLCAGYMSEIASAIGRTSDETRYHKRLISNTAAFHKQFYNGADKAPKPGTRCCYDSGSQTSNIQALILNAVPKPLLPAVLKTFVASIHNRNASATPADEGTAQLLALADKQSLERDPRRQLESLRLSHPPGPSPMWSGGPHMDCGIFGTTFFFDALVAHEHEALGIDVLTNTGYPSLGYMVTNGATTLWEAWEGDAHHIGGGGSSRNHIMFGGGVARFIAASVAGLSTDDKVHGWKKLLVHPSPHALRNVGASSVSRNTPQGLASVEWSASTSAQAGTTTRVSMSVTVPAGATASLRLPLLLTSLSSEDAKTLAVTHNGKEQDATSFVRRPSDGEYVLAKALRAGTHTFAVTV